MRARVLVRLKREVLDPQGEAVRRALVALGIDGIRDARVGKIIELEVDMAPELAQQQIERAAKSLLANPVIEDFEITLENDS
ncbi:MAG: phosphoribosylformylglycinamidine synthase subunit PurS [Deltaproteobacteria bacterium]|nr:phosphoribosylformylglycinamidine synthase subunit PurS [Deltaproteobacteria bacterium]